jgi:hypothetical protein
VSSIAIWGGFGGGLEAADFLVFEHHGLSKGLALFVHFTRSPHVALQRFTSEATMLHHTRNNTTSLIS